MGDFYSLIDYTVIMQTKSAKKTILLDILAQLSPDSSKNTLRNWVKKGRVTIDEKVAKKASQIVEEGQTVLIGAKREELKSGLKIVYEDLDIIVIDKPAGLLSVATEKEIYHSAHASLKRQFHTRRIYPIHRLDRETSGLLVFACRDKSRAALKTQMEKREIHRQYLARVHGFPDSGTWKSYLREDIQLFMRICDSSRGKEAITHFETVKKARTTSFLKCTLETGRKHQIRVQAAEAGHPIVGDDKYGLESDGGKRLHLHAVKLSFQHPTTKKPLTFTSKATF